MKQIMKSPVVLAIAAAAALTAGSVAADPVSVEIGYTTEEDIRFEFPDKSGHFILAVRRQGTAEGSGIFDGASVTDLGWHDVHPPIEGNPLGYFHLQAENGDSAVLRWMAKATFTQGEGGPGLVNHGVWELVRGTGAFENKRGVGSIVLKPSEQKVILEGDVGDKPS